MSRKRATFPASNRVQLPGQPTLINPQHQGTPTAEQKVIMGLQRVELALRGAMVYGVGPQILINILEATVESLKETVQDLPRVVDEE